MKGSNVSDIVTRLWGNTGDKYPGFQNLNTEAAAEITRLRARLAAWKAEAEAWREWYYNEPEVIVNKPTLLQEAIKCVAATDAIEKNAS